jgi:hypothetical protein
MDNPHICEQPGVTLAYVSQALELAELMVVHGGEPITLELHHQVAIQTYLRGVREAADDAMAKLDEGRFRSRDGLDAI